MLRRWRQRAGACLPSFPPMGKKRVSRCVTIKIYITCRCPKYRLTRNPRTAAIHVADSYGWCADAQHHLRPRRCMDGNPQLVMRCAGAHHHCRPRRCVDSNHLRVTRCAGAHHHPRPPPRERSVCQVAHVSQHTLRAGAQQSGQPPHGKEACVKMCAYHNTHYVLSLIHI